MGCHSKSFLSKGKNVTGIDIKRSYVKHKRYTHIRQSFDEVNADADLVWSCHTLEHVPDPGSMLRKFREWVRPDGYLAIAVPCSTQDKFHVGHLSIWTPAHLMYNLVVSGWDCSKAKWYTGQKTIGALLQKTDDISFSGRTAMPSEREWLNQYMPLEIIHEGNSWWPDNWD